MDPDDWVSAARALVSLGATCRWWRALSQDDAMWSRLHRIVFGGPARPWWMDADLNDAPARNRRRQVFPGDDRVPFPARPEVQPSGTLHDFKERPLRELLMSHAKVFLSERMRAALIRSDIGWYRAFAIKAEGFRELLDEIRALKMVGKSLGGTTRIDPEWKRQEKRGDRQKQIKQATAAKAFQETVRIGTVAAIMLGCEEIIMNIVKYRESNIKHATLVTELSHQYALFWASAVPSPIILTVHIIYTTLCCHELTLDSGLT